VCSSIVTAAATECVKPSKTTRLVSLVLAANSYHVGRLHQYLNPAKIWPNLPKMARCLTCQSHSWNPICTYHNRFNGHFLHKPVLASYRPQGDHSRSGTEKFPDISPNLRDTLVPMLLLPKSCIQKATFTMLLYTAVQSINQSISLFGDREQLRTIKCTSLSLSTRTPRHGLH